MRTSFFGSTLVTVTYLSPQMRTLLHLLSLLHLSAASLPANYLPRPGAILEDIGTISFVSSYVEITISLDVLSSFYNTASTHLSLITQYRHAISTDTSLTPPQVSSLLSFLSLSQADLTPFKDRLPRPHPRRQRRGLFNFMGHITSYLFGVATHDELHARFGDYERALSSVAGKFKATFGAIHTISDTVNSLNNVTRQLSIYTDTNAQLIAREQHFTLLLAHVSLYQSRVRLFVDHLNTLTHDLILAVHGSVMPSLIPPSTLDSFIRRISAETRFTPLFSMANATLLYSLLESFITPHGLSVLVPLSPDKTSESIPSHSLLMAPFTVSHLTMTSSFGH